MVRKQQACSVRYCRKYCWSSSFLYKLMSQAEGGPETWKEPAPTILSNSYQNSVRTGEKCRLNQPG